MQEHQFEAFWKGFWQRLILGFRLRFGLRGWKLFLFWRFLFGWNDLRMRLFSDGLELFNLSLKFLLQFLLLFFMNDRHFSYFSIALLYLLLKPLFLLSKNKIFLLLHFKRLHSPMELAIKRLEQSLLFFGECIRWYHLKGTFSHIVE